MSIFRRLRDFVGDDAAKAEPSALEAIAARLERLEEGKAQYVAAFAFVLARVAYADLSIDDAETDEIRHRVALLGGLEDSEAEIVGDIARTLAKQVGGTENYTITREFRRVSNHPQRIQLLECLNAVAAADGEISSAETTEIANIAEELGLTRADATAVRAQWRSHLAELKNLRGRA